MKLIKNLAPLLGLALIFTACEDPTKDVNLHFAPQMYKYVMEVELYDFTDLSKLYRENVQVEVYGPDAGKIYNIDGTKNFSANFGRILLITDASGEPTEGNPLEFSVKISSNEFEEKDVNFTVPFGQTHAVQPAFLVSQINLPQGLIRSSGSTPLNSSGELDQAFQFDATPAGNANALGITIPAGIEFQDADGLQIQGSNLNLNVTSYDAAQSEVNLALPNEGFHIYTENGQTVTYLIPVDGVFKVKMDVDGQAVKRFTGSGVNLRMPIPNNIENKDANRPFQAGDKIALMSFSDGDLSWKDEGIYTIIDDNGSLYIEPKVNHLSYFSIATIPSGNAGSRYSMKLINGMQEEGDISAISNSIFSFTVDVNAKTFNTLSFRSFFNRAFGFDKWKIEDFLDKDLIIRHDQPQITVAARACASCYVENGTEIVKIEITPVGTNHFDILFRSPINYVNVGYTLRCEGDEATFQPPYGSGVYFRESGTSSEEWKWLYTFSFEAADNRLHRLRGLADGSSYDFKVTWYTIELYQTSLTLEEGKIFELELTEDQCSKIGF